jgi:hypothetical protein
VELPDSPVIEQYIRCRAAWLTCDLAINKMWSCLLLNLRWIRQLHILFIAQSQVSQAAPYLILMGYGNLYWHLQAMSPTIYAAKFKQTITHQHMLLRWKSQSYRWSICSIILCLHVLIAHHIFIAIYLDGKISLAHVRWTQSFKSGNKITK